MLPETVSDLQMTILSLSPTLNFEDAQSMSKLSMFKFIKNRHKSLISIGIFDDKLFIYLIKPYTKSIFLCGIFWVTWCADMVDSWKLYSLKMVAASVIKMWVTQLGLQKWSTFLDWLTYSVNNSIKCWIIQ